MKRRQAGFSLLEVAMVVVIAMIVTAIAIPAVRRTMTSYKLDTSGHAVASMLQQVRSTAVKNNTPYYAQYNATVTLNGPGAPVTLNGEVIAIPAPRLNPPTYFADRDPTVAISDNIIFQPLAAAAIPNHAQLDAYLGVAPDPGAAIGFNARGIPCTATAGNPFLCDTAVPHGFEWFMQSNIGAGWEAITITPSGRIRAWRLTSTGGGGCAFPSCWQ